MNRVARNGIDRAHSHSNSHSNTSHSNGGGVHRNCAMDYYCSPPTIESFDGRGTGAGDRGIHNYNNNAIPSHDRADYNCNYTNANANSHTNSHTNSYTNSHNSSCINNAKHVLPPSLASSPKYPKAQSTNDGFDSAQIGLNDLQIGSASSTMKESRKSFSNSADQSFSLPTQVQERKMPQPSTQYKSHTHANANAKSFSHCYTNQDSSSGKFVDQERSSCGNVNKKNFRVHPSHQRSPSPSRRIHVYNRRQLRKPYQEEPHDRPTMLKKPPPSYVSPFENHSTAKQQSPPSSSLQTPDPHQKSHSDRHQQNHHQHRSHDLKPPPPSLFSPPPQRTKKKLQDYFGVRNDLPKSLWPASSARVPSVPKAIDVDLSYNNSNSFHYYPEAHDPNNLNHAAPPPALSPISFSSSMFLKRVDNYYPSKDIIEKQLSSSNTTLPTLSAIFPTIVSPVQVPFADRLSTHANYDCNVNSIGAARVNTIDVTRNGNGGVAATATATADITDSPSSEGFATSAYKNRPEKPLRINSHFPSQLQLQQQQRRQPNKQQQQRKELHPSPRPLPKGNGITNGVATGIDATPPMTRRKNLRSFVPHTHDQEYDLQLSMPAAVATTTLPPPPPPPLAPPPSNIRHQLQENRGNNNLAISHHHRGNLATVTTDHSLLSPESTSTSTSTSPIVKVEIYPGVSCVLRGAQETAEAAKRKFVVECACLICTSKFSCIADAAFVICPACLVVNSLDLVIVATGINTSSGSGSGSGSSIHNNAERWGVGLGFLPED